MRKESVTARGFRRRYIQLGIDGDIAFHKTKLLLGLYRKVVWSVNDRYSNLCDFGYEAGEKDIRRGFEYLADFAPDIDKDRFESEVSCLFESKLIIDMIENALLRVKEYPDFGQIYYDILYKQYFMKYRFREREIIETMSFERSVFYTRKKEAISLFGVALFGYVIPELKNTIWRCSDGLPT